MAFVVTKIECFGQEMDEPLTKRFRQIAVLSYTAANTDVALDVGNYTGTFWTAAGGTDTGATALKCFKSIQTKANAFISAGGEALTDRVPIDASRPGAIKAIRSSASSGGSATETMTVTGLLTTDTILSVDQDTDGSGAAVGILAYGTAGAAAANNALSVTWNADPGANAIIKVSAIATTVTTPDAGTYLIAMNGTNTHVPDITFASGSAPTVGKIYYLWDLKDNEIPVATVATA